MRMHYWLNETCEWIVLMCNKHTVCPMPAFIKCLHKWRVETPLSVPHTAMLQGIQTRCDIQCTSSCGLCNTCIGFTKNKIHLKTLVVFWKITAYWSTYTVLVLLPLCKFCTPVMLSLLIAKSTVKVHPITGHEGPERQCRYTSTFYLSSALYRMGGQCHTPAALPTGNDLVPTVQKAGLAQGQSGYKWKILSSLGSANCPAHSKSLHQLC